MRKRKGRAKGRDMVGRQHARLARWGMPLLYREKQEGIVNTRHRMKGTTGALFAILELRNASVHLQLVS